MRTKQNYTLLFLLILSGIVCLFLNDRIWKYTYSNEFTGKLSDFLGLLTLPLLLGILFPRYKFRVSVFIGILFVFWKLPISEPIINFWNQFMPGHLARTIDYSDLLALSMLFFTHNLLAQMDIPSFRAHLKFRFHPAFLNWCLAFSFLVFCSTSVMKKAYPIGDVYLNKTYVIPLSSEKILEYSSQMGYEIIRDSFRYSGEQYDPVHWEFYQIKELVVNEHFNYPDTLLNINFELAEHKKGSSLTLLNFSLKSNRPELQDWKALKKMAKEYRTILKQDWIDPLSKMVD